MPLQREGWQGSPWVGGRRCQTPPWVWGALCTWEVWGGHGCRGGHCPGVPVSCGPHSAYAVTMSHAHVPQPVL